jgi:hypothetical protein
MAIAVGDRVRPRLSSTGTLGLVSRLNPQPMVWGVVTMVVDGGEAPDTIYATIDEPRVTVTINPSALRPAGVSADALDLLAAPDATLRAAIIDKMVVGLEADAETEWSSEYIGKVVDFFTLNGVPTVVVLTGAGLYYELPFTRIKLVTNR